VNSLFGLSSDNFLLKISKVADILESYFSHFDIAKKRIPMLARFPLQASAHTTRLSRLGEWWPAALIGLLALMTGSPDGNAQTLLGLF